MTARGEPGFRGHAIALGPRRRDQPARADEMQGAHGDEGSEPAASARDERPCPSSGRKALSAPADGEGAGRRSQPDEAAPTPGPDRVVDLLPRDDGPGRPRPG